jgi:hypothetical protein
VVPHDAFPPDRREAQLHPSRPRLHHGGPLPHLDRLCPHRERVALRSSRNLEQIGAAVAHRSERTHAGGRRRVLLAVDDPFQALAGDPELAADRLHAT